MADTKKLASSILEAVGGKDNITFITHCMTRLRLNLKDESIVDDEEVRKIKGVVGVRRVAGQYQIIIGTSVDEVCTELITLAGLSQEEGTTENKKGFFAKLMKLISGIMMPVLPALIACGIVNALVPILSSAGALAPEDGMYVLLHAIGNSCMYFFPVIIGGSAARFFGMDAYIGAVVGASLIHPSLAALSTSGGSIDIAGLSIPAASYASTVFPAIVAAWFASVIYKGFKKILPEVVGYAIVPALTVLICAPISYLVIGPVVNAASDLLAQGILAIYAPNPVVCSLILNPIFGLVLIPLGLHWALVVVCINNLVTLGSDPILGLVCNGMGVVGMVLAYAYKESDPDKRSLGLSTALTAFCGITEPALYGVILPNKRMMLASVLSGTIPSIIPALFGTRAFTMAGSGIFSFPSYMNPTGDMNSLIGAVLTNAIGFVCGFIVTVALHKFMPDKGSNAAEAQAA